MRRRLHGWKTLSEMKAAVKISVKLLGMMISAKLPVLAVLLPLGLIGRGQRVPRCMRLWKRAKTP